VRAYHKVTLTNRLSFIAGALLPFFTGMFCSWVGDEMITQSGVNACGHLLVARVPVLVAVAKVTAMSHFFRRPRSPGTRSSNRGRHRGHRGATNEHRSSRAGKERRCNFNRVYGTRPESGGQLPPTLAAEPVPLLDSEGAPPCRGRAGVR
jgi:hypothetical protein